MSLRVSPRRAASRHREHEGKVGYEKEGHRNCSCAYNDGGSPPSGKGSGTALRQEDECVCDQSGQLSLLSVACVLSYAVPRDHNRYRTLPPQMIVQRTRVPRRGPSECLLMAVRPK